MVFAMNWYWWITLYLFKYQAVLALVASKSKAEVLSVGSRLIMVKTRHLHVTTATFKWHTLFQIFYLEQSFKVSKLSLYYYYTLFKMLLKPRHWPKKTGLICPVPFLGFWRKKFRKSLFWFRFVDILGGQENVARDDKILVRDWRKLIIFGIFSRSVIKNNYLIKK
jgi:hypothetical protein